MEIYSLVEWQKTRQALQEDSHNKGQMIEDITNTSRVNASGRLVYLFIHSFIPRVVDWCCVFQKRYYIA